MVKIESFIFSRISKKLNDLSFTEPDETRWKSTVIYEVMSLNLDRSMHRKLRTLLRKISILYLLIFLYYHFKCNKGKQSGSEPLLLRARDRGGFSWFVQRRSVSSLSWPKMKTAQWPHEIWVDMHYIE